MELTAASPSGLDDEKPAVLQAETCLGREETLPARESPHLRYGPIGFSFYVYILCKYLYPTSGI